MFGKIKKTLGIETVTIQLQLPEKANISDQKIEGNIKLTSKSDENKIEQLELKLIERYTRGRGNDKRIDEYTIGYLVIDDGFDMNKNDIIEIPFTLNYTIYKSEMDKIQDKNIFARGIVGLAKKIRGVQSEFVVEAQAILRDTTLNPVDKKPILLAN